MRAGNQGWRFKLQAAMVVQQNGQTMGNTHGVVEGETDDLGYGFIRRYATDSFGLAGPWTEVHGYHHGTAHAVRPNASAAKIDSARLEFRKAGCCSMSVASATTDGSGGPWSTEAGGDRCARRVATHDRTLPAQYL